MQLAQRWAVDTWSSGFVTCAERTACTFLGSYDSASELRCVLSSACDYRSSASKVPCLQECTSIRRFAVAGLQQSQAEGDIDRVTPVACSHRNIGSQANDWLNVRCVTGCADLRYKLPRRKHHLEESKSL